MRVRLGVALVVALAVCTTAATARAASALIVTGHGWGHGVGLSQWGAYGYAQHGWTYDRILTHYYSGTTIERRPTPTIRVLLLDGASTVTVGSEGPWIVTDANGTKVKLPAGTRNMMGE